MDDARHDDLDALVDAIPEGWSRVRIDGQDWGVTRTTRAAGGVISVDADRLADDERFGANVWRTSDGTVLRPCEVPPEKVMHFLRAASTAFSR
ncbi:MULTISPECIES: peptide methionine sulfoxide reductase [unclassified Microbacterium]|uniref:peptide methionine sulfoxide reductase n=1 Tax=unclassified Microbacterium TaxID=2609290 RepID=UPI000EA9DB3B|nr:MULTISPECIES: peptide methionine sulfoxide reductase [unclassified Microbacterium]MBT2486744.1 peptide methionine sulfoxide reductase [Microbacterium sp. ISL-108]RKN64676.1 peptide methionine sulfoxide reductase [Microbacterium sp. CGR2]